MTGVQLLFPVFVQVALTFVLLVATGRTRIAAVNAGDVRAPDIALGQRAWPDLPTKLANAYQNQFELPVLFYAVIAFLIVTNTAAAIDLYLAWAFVASRIVHALIYATTNRVSHRFAAFTVGVIPLAAMWVLLASRLLFHGGN